MKVDFDVNERVTKDFKKLMKPWALPTPKKYCFKNVNVIDVLNNKIIESAIVCTENGKITSISVEPIQNGADSVVIDKDGNCDEHEIIDCEGKYLCPGLFDNHVHVVSVPGEKDLQKSMLMSKTTVITRMGKICKDMLDRGFTTLRDCGGTEAYIKNAINDGSIHGPRLVIAGHAISQTGGHGDFMPAELPEGSFDSCSCHLNLLGKVADGVDECYKAAREELRRGADFIKMMGSGGVASPTDKITNVQYCDDEIQALVRIAKSYGTYVTAHAYTPESIQHCIRNGVKGIEHGNLLDEKTAKIMAENGAYLTPTLVTYKIMASEQFSSFFSEDTKSKNLQVLYKGLDAIKIAKEQNVKICYGSDLLGPLGGYQTQEFFIRGKILSAHDVLVSATITPAEMNGLQDQLGQIKEGFIADMILLDKNPLEDIAILDEPEKHLRFVMKEGLVYTSKFSKVPTDFE